MSINAVSPHSSIWARATTALTNTPLADTPALKPNDAGTQPTPAGRPDPSRATPFHQLSSNLQSVLIQVQSRNVRDNG